MKQTYIQPSTTVVRLQHHSIICQSPTVRSIINPSEEGFGYGGGGSGEAYAKGQTSIWDEEW